MLYFLWYEQWGVSCGFNATSVPDHCVCVCTLSRVPERERVCTCKWEWEHNPGTLPLQLSFLTHCTHMRVPESVVMAVSVSPTWKCCTLTPDPFRSWDRPGPVKSHHQVLILLYLLWQQTLVLNTEDFSLWRSSYYMPSLQKLRLCLGSQFMSSWNSTWNPKPCA